MTDDTEPVRQAYDRIAADYDRRWKPYVDATLKTVLQACEFNGDETVLDVPCGTGALAQPLLSRWSNLKITGIDLSSGMLRQAKKKDAEQRATWIEADVANLPLSDESFDVVLCANSFHYFRSPGKSLCEIRRVLRAEGTFILVDWCDDYLTCKICSLWLRWTDPAFHRTYTRRACRSLLEDAGFEIASEKRFRINWLWGLMRFVCH